MSHATLRAFSVASKSIFLAVAALTTLACATSDYDRDRSSYFDAAYNDRNRAPASMTPPQNAADLGERVDISTQRAQADYHFAAGEAYSFDGLHSKAIESFKSVLIYDADSAQVRLRLAAEYVKMGAMSEALRQGEEALAKDPKRTDTHLLLGGLYSNLKNYPKAISSYEAALKLDPKNTDALMYLGAVYAERKAFDKAVKYFEALAKEDNYQTPQTAFYYIGRIREDQGTKPALKASEAAFKKAIELKPDYLEATVGLSGFYIRQKKSALALEVMRKFQRDHGPNLKIADLLSSLYLQEEKYDLALDQLEILESDPDEALNVKVKMALIYIDQKQFPQAAAKLTEVLKQAPESDKIRFYLAAVYEEMGVADKAIEHFSKVPATSSFYQDSVVHAAYLLKETKRNKEAIKLVGEALKERKDIPQFYAVYASLMDDSGQVDGAIVLLKEGIEKFPDYVQLRFFMGTLLDRKGEKEQSIEHMKKVVEMDPNHVQGLNYLAFSYADLGIRLEEAESLVKRALEMEPKDGYILDTYGWVLFKLGKTNEAIRVLEAAHSHQPDESIIAEHLGDAYYRSQFMDKARRMYEKAVEHASDETKVREIRMKITAIEKQEVVGFSKRQPASLVSPETKDPNSDK